MSDYLVSRHDSHACVRPVNWDDARTYAFITLPDGAFLVYHCVDVGAWR